MAHLVNNADEYTVGRLNIFFTAHNQTSADGNLTGQCVTLVKWFMQDMSDVPSPFAARGDARYVGKNLVAQGHAVEVPYSDRKRGDIICYEYGEYGHIAVQLSGGRVFEENVNLGGVAAKTVDGSVVYASRIGSENESWRSSRNPHVYRLKTYSEGGNMNLDQAKYLAQRIGLLGHMSEAEITPDWVNYHANNIVADPNYAAALAKQLYEGHQWQNDVWKSVHFEDEVQKAYEKGKAEGGGDGDFVETKVYVKKG